MCTKQPAIASQLRGGSFSSDAQQCTKLANRKMAFACSRKTAPSLLAPATSPNSIMVHDPASDCSSSDEPVMALATPPDLAANEYPIQPLYALTPKVASLTLTSTTKGNYSTPRVA